MQSFCHLLDPCLVELVLSALLYLHPVTGGNLRFVVAAFRKIIQGSFFVNFDNVAILLQ